MNMPYIGVSISALACYTFMLGAFALKRNNSLINTLKGILIASLAWTFSDFAMRQQWAPGENFWFQMSFVAETMLPVVLYIYINIVLDFKGFLFQFNTFLITVVLDIINITTSFFISAPDIVKNADGGVCYSYDVGWPFAILIGIEVILFLHVICVFMQTFQKRRELVKQCIPLFVGSLFLLLGNVLVVLPGNVFPWDTLMSLFFVVCLFYMIASLHLIDISKSLLSGIVYSFAVIAVIYPWWGIQDSLTLFLEDWCLSLKATVIFMCALSIAWFLFVFLIARIVVKLLVIRFQDEKMKLIDEFQEEVSSSLDEEEILDSLLTVTEKILPVVAIRIRMRNQGSDKYTTVRNQKLMEGKGVRGMQQQWVDATNEDGAEGFWNSELLSSGDLRYDKTTWGHVDIFGKKRILGEENWQYFQQLCSYASIALKNARIYKEAYIDSISDDMTKLYSRKYAEQVIEEDFPEEGNASVIALELDDLKLYNELYGTDQGDQLICWFASALQKMCGDGKAFRYGSNEYLIHLPDTSVKDAFQLAENIRLYVEQESQNKENDVHPVTITAGVAQYPEIAPKRKKLIGYAQRGAFYGKQNGKNSVTIYSRNIEEENAIEQSYDQIAPTIYALTAAIDAKDSYTFVHSEKVSEYASILGEAIGLHKDEIMTLKQAGMLHDIGKIGVPESILKKRGRLTAAEYEVMKGHVNNSIKMIHYLPDLNYVIPAVVSHHERYDGHGYPEELSGEGIPLMGRILSIADCFDAMTARRPYKPPLSIEYAKEEIMKNAGTQFDPALAAVFVQLIDEGKITVNLSNAEEIAISTVS